MKATYLIESLDGIQVFGYFNRLSDAKESLKENHKPNSALILCLKGNYFGEGWHKYRLKFNGSKFIKAKGGE